MSDITKLNGQYVKFYCSTNTKMPAILRNTGSVVIVHKNAENNEYSYNEFWLGDNFIATGYGFGSFDIKQVLDKYGSAYGYFDSLLDYKFDEAYNAYNSSIDHSDNLYNDIVENFVNNYGDASNAYIMYDSYEFPLSYLPLLHDVAEYKDAEPMYFNSSLHGYPYATTGVTASLNPTTNNENVLCNSQFASNKVVFDLPVGTTINKFNVTSYILLNDVNITNSELWVSYVYKSEERSLNWSDTFVEYIYGESTSVPNGYNYIDEYSRNIHKIDLNCISHDNIYVKEGLHAALYARIHYNGSDSYTYKFYPILSEEKNINIYSLENAIKPGDYNIASIYINGHLEMTAYNTNSTVLPSNFSQQHLHPSQENINNAQFKRSMIIDNNAYVDTTLGYVYIAIPQCYSIKSAKWIRNSNQAPLHQSYINWTGNIYRDINNIVSDRSYKQYHAAYYSNDNNIKYIIYDHYVTFMPEDGKRLYFEFLRNRNNNEIIFDKVTTDTIELQSNNIDVTDNFVQNQEYNSSHWFKPKDLSYIYMK